jgi:rubrerythrin
MEAFLKYFEMTEKKGWRIQDLPWDRADWERVSERDRRAVLATSAIESGVPHYTKLWLLTDNFAQDWELAQFVSLWAGEEERHNVALQRASTAMGLKQDDSYELIANIDFVKRQKDSCPTKCYQTVIGMLTYTMMQEIVTWKFYSQAAKQSSSTFLATLFGKLAEDEMRHHVWYREALKTRFAKATLADQETFLHSIVDAVNHFEMPHFFYQMYEDYFAANEVLGRLSQLDIKLRLAKVFTFDKRIIPLLMKGKFGGGSMSEENLSAS